MPRVSSRRLHLSVPLRVLLIGGVLTAAATIMLQRYYDLQTRRRIVENATNFEARLAARLEAYLAVLRGGVGLYATMPNVRGEDFRQYVAQIGLGSNYPGIQGVGVSVCVPASELEAFVAQARKDGSPSFHVWPEYPREEYHTIVYLEPMNVRNQAAIGYDMYSEPVRHAAMLRARMSGQPAATGKVTLVQEIDRAKQAGFLIYVPFYRGASWPATEEERGERLAGFVYSPFRAGDLIRAVGGDKLPDGMGVEFYDGATTDPSARIFSVAPSSAGQRDPVRQTRHLSVVDRQWTLVYSAVSRGLFLPWMLLLVGLAGSCGVSLLVQRQYRERERAERSEAVTRERENELAILVEAVPAVVSFIDRSGVVRLTNRRFREWFGFEPHDVIGRSVRDIMGPKTYVDVEPLVARAMRGETVSLERWYNVPKTGARFLSTFIVPHHAGDGALIGFYSLTSDLTSMKRAEEAARFVADCGKLIISSLDYESTTRGIVHLAVPRIADMALLFRYDNGFLQASAIAHVDDAIERRLSEFLRDAKAPLTARYNFVAAARTGMVVISPEVSTEHLDRIAETAEQRELLQVLQLCSTMHVPVVVRGQIWAVLSLGASAESGRRFTDEHRSLADEIATRIRLGVENALLHEEAKQEIEERRRAERTVVETEERFRLLVEGARDYAIILLDPDGLVASWNDGAERILGFGESEAIGLAIARLYAEEDRMAGAPEDELARARDTGSALEERWYVRKDGTRFWASGHTVVLRTDDGLIRGYAKIMRDLTGRKISEEELEQRVQQRTLELNEAVQELEAFSYSVSHDLRAPLRSIRGFTEMALEEAGERLTADERGYLGRVQRAASRLDRLISDLLAYTRVSKTRVDLGAIDVHALVSDIRREHPEFQPPLADVQILGHLEPVQGNVAYLTQCLTNVIGNAVKFVKPGQTPVVRIWSERHGAAVRLFVRDHGIGIPQENLGRVFEMFERLHAGSQYEGTGVGLAIVRRAVQRMKGALGVDSKLGDGTTFWIELAAVDHDAVPAPPSTESLG